MAYPVAACRGKTLGPAGSGADGAFWVDELDNQIIDQSSNPLVFHEPVDLCADTFGFTGGSDNLDCYVEELSLTQVLGQGTGWGNPWTVFNRPIGLQGEDSFDFYSQGDATTLDLNLGTGWSGSWVVFDRFAGTGGNDGFDTYAPEAELY